MPSLERFDHLHVYVKNRAAAEEWYKKILGLSRVAELEFWARDNGPLTIGNESGSIHIALFEKAYSGLRPTLALAVSAEGFLCWLKHLKGQGIGELKVMDHDVSWSMYFKDPDENSYEITTYEYAKTSEWIGSEV